MILGWVSAGLGLNQALGNPLGSLTGGSSPPNVNTSGTQQTQLPSWYTSYMQGALGTGQALASQPYAQYTGQRLAGFNDTQNTAFNNINNAQGNWQSTLNGGLSTANAVPTIAGQAAGLANQYGGSAYGAASQPVTSWTDPGVASQWMSPYTGSVVNSIAQQGVQNWNTNLMPGIEAQFIGAGNPNSSANAAALGVGAANTQANISALQSQALQSGYQNAMQGQQANQAQILQQQGLQANTGLGAAGIANQGGQLGVTGGLGAASALQSGAQAGQTMNYNDIAQQLAAGNAQQQLAQTGYNTAYQNFLNQQQYPWTQLQNLNQIATGAQLPTSTSATGSAPLAGATYGPSAAALGYGAYTSGLGSQISNLFSPSYTQAPSATPMGPPASLAGSGTTTAKRGGLYRASAARIKRARGGSVSPLQMATMGGHRGRA